MNINGDGICCKAQRHFQLRFQRQLCEYLADHSSVAEGFGVVWERTLDEVPLDDMELGQVYRELIEWAQSDELFTKPNPANILRL